MAAAVADLAKPAGDHLLAGLTAAYVFFDRHVIVKRIGDLIDPCAGDHSIFKQILGIIRTQIRIGFRPSSEKTSAVGLHSPL